ncbi:NUDIX domain-containing protein [Dermabacteraceae bacterium CCM 9520]
MRPHAPVRFILLAGPSGSGKSVLTSRFGAPVVELDDFYRDLDDPGLPRRFGIVDWDNSASWHREQALAALLRLSREGRAEIPTYSIPLSRRTGSRELVLQGQRLVVAEGIFAAELIPDLAARGLLADAVVISRPRALNFALRLGRDLRQNRKPPLTLLRRGSALFREEHQKMRAWRGAGMRPLSMSAAVRHLRRLEDYWEADAYVNPPRTLRIAALCIVRDGARGPEVLTVRKKGTDAFMLPGGKLEPGESDRECAAREVGEELGLEVSPESLTPLGSFSEWAANEADTRVEAGVFVAPEGAAERVGEVRAEIAESLWCPLYAPQEGVRFAPLSTLHVMPLLQALYPPR